MYASLQRIIFGSSLVLVVGVVGFFLLSGPQALVQQTSPTERVQVAHTEVTYFEQGVRLFFTAPLFTTPVTAYEVRYSAIEFGAEDFIARWDALDGRDGQDYTTVDATYKEGALEKMLFHPTKPGNYYVAVRGVVEDGGYTDVLFIERVYIPLMEYHKVATTLPRKGIVPGLEHVTLEREGSSAYLTFAAPYSSIVSYDVRYAKEKLSAEDFAVYWNTAFCRDDNSCVFMENVKMQEGHKERIYIRDMPEAGQTYTYGIQFTLKTGEVSSVSIPVHVEGQVTRGVTLDSSATITTNRLYDALRGVGVTYQRGKVRLSWETPRDQVEYYVIRYAEEELDQETLDARWDALPCYAGANCTYAPSEGTYYDGVMLAQVPQDTRVYTYGVRYKVRGKEGLSRLHDPVYVVNKNIQSWESTLPKTKTAQVRLQEDASLPSIQDVRVEEAGDAFYIVFSKPVAKVFAYQLHYVQGAVTPATLLHTPVACTFVQHPTIRLSDSCSPYYTVIKDGSGEDREVRLQLRNVQFPGIHTFFVRYYDEDYKSAMQSNFVTVERPVTVHTLAEGTMKKIADFRLLPEQEAVLYEALAEGLIDPEFSQFVPEVLVNRVLFARYMFFARSGKLDIAKVNYWSVFCDVARDQWYAPYAFLLYQMGIIGGYDDGACVTKKNFVPENHVPRAEALKMLFSFYQITPPQITEDIVLPGDVPRDAWYAPYVLYALREGIIQTNGEGNAEPMKPLTSLEAMNYVLGVRSFVIQSLQKGL